MPTLHELQASFAVGLRGAQCDVNDWAVGDGIPAAARLRIYANNSRAVFEQALEQTFPVLRRRVGDDYFRQLSHQYRRAHPSGAGDLHEVGRCFADFLAGHLSASPYAWLAELARLEWAVADAAVAADVPAVGVQSLAGLAPDVLADIRLRLVPSLRLVTASVPVLTLWQANQPAMESCTTDLAAGPQCVVVHRAPDGVQLRSVGYDEFEFVAAVESDQTLAEALKESSLQEERLAQLLHWLFADAAVAGIRLPASD